MPSVMAAAAAVLFAVSACAFSTEVAPPWHGQTPRDLHNEYHNIFRHGNRNAASHLWSSFLVERAPQMTAARFEALSAGYCAVSGSPVSPSDYTRYLLRLQSVKDTDTLVAGFMYYCCWPCVCDTQDFIKVDTLTVQLADGPKQYHVAVLGNPCERPDALNRPFYQPFDGRETTLAREAAEVRCSTDGKLVGATLSDHGYTVISIFFDAQEVTGSSGAVVPSHPTGNPTPGRMSKGPSGLPFQDEYEYGPMCQDRARNGYNSGMGEIFRKVAEISPVVPGSRPPLLGSVQGEPAAATAGGSSESEAASARGSSKDVTANQSDL